MFGSNAKHAPQTPVVTNGTVKKVTVIGSGGELEGKLKVAHDLDVEGSVNGPVISNGKVRIFNGGKILNGIVAQKVVIQQGFVTGAIRAVEVEITGDVNLTCESIVTGSLIFTGKGRAMCKLDVDPAHGQKITEELGLLFGSQPPQV